MEKHDYCDCSRLHHYNKVPKIALRWQLSLIFITLSFIIMRPLIVKQLISRASSYMACELFNDAIRSFKKAVFIDKKNIVAWNMLGYSYKSNGDLNKSVYAYRQAIKTDPKDINANFSLGAILASKKRYKEAVPYLEQIIKSGRDEQGKAIVVVSYYKSSLKLLVSCYEALKEFDKMNNALEELRRYCPEDNMILNEANPGRLFKQ